MRLRTVVIETGPVNTPYDVTGECRSRVPLVLAVDQQSTSHFDERLENLVSSWGPRETENLPTSDTERSGRREYGSE